MTRGASGLSPSDWNWCVLMLNQALLGAVSPNFRRVELGFEDSKWVVRVTLREESDEDREEVDDICDYFVINLEDIRDRIDTRAYTAAVPEIIISSEPLAPTCGPEPRVVFLARSTQVCNSPD